MERAPVHVFKLPLIVGMIIRAIDSSGDWLWGQNLASFATGQNAVAENVQTRLRFFKNDFFAAMNDGVDWFALLGGVNPESETGILLQCREVIITSYGIVAINAIDVVENATARAIQVLYNLSSIFTTSFASAVQPPQSPT